MSQALTQLHLGLGSFHRAHQALYMQFLHDKGDTSWEIAGGNIRPDMAELIEAMQSQGGQYMLETVTPQGEREYKQISSIKRIISWDAELAGLTAVAVEPALYGGASAGISNTGPMGRLVWRVGAGGNHDADRPA